MGEKQSAGRPKWYNRRHIIQLSPELDKQLTEALEIARLKVMVEPVSATLGNPTAFPILTGFIGIFALALYLRFRFPNPLAQARINITEAAEEAARFLEEQKATAEGKGLTQTAVDATKATLMWFYDGLVNAGEALGGRRFDPLAGDPLVDL